MASVTKLKSGKWQARWVDPAGRNRGKAFRLKGDAQAHAREVERALATGTYTDRDSHLATVGDYATAWERIRAMKVARSTSDRDHSHIKNHILPTFGARPVASVTASDVELWAAGDLAHLAPATSAKCLQLLRSIIDLAQRDGVVDRNAAKGVRQHRKATERVRQPRVLSADDLAGLIDAAEVIDSDTAGIVWVMASCGLRIGEALALKRTDIDLTAGTLTVARNLSRSEGVKAPKTKAGTRTVPMPSNLRARMADHLAQRPAHIGGWLFTGSQGGMWTYPNWRKRRWALITNLAAMPGVNPHDLRHTVTTRLVTQDGFGPAQLMAFLGHADARTSLQVYAHLTADDLPRPSSIPGVS